MNPQVEIEKRNFSEKNGITGHAAVKAGYIQLDRVSKWFETVAGRFDAIRDISLSLSQGEYAAVVGKSGSGKTTLLNLLTGIDHPSQGQIKIDSTTLNSLNESRLAKWRGANVGIVFQFFQLIPTLSISENLLIAMDFVGKIAGPEKKERALHLLEQVGIAEQKDKFPAELSGGQQQRAAIARALANDPPILVADEPTGNLDAKTSEAVQAIFAELVQTGKTVIVVTHEKNDRGAFNRVISLSDGKIINDEQIGA